MNKKKKEGNFRKCPLVMIEDCLIDDNSITHEAYFYGTGQRVDEWGELHEQGFSISEIYAFHNPFELEKYKIAFAIAYYLGHTKEINERIGKNINE